MTMSALESECAVYVSRLRSSARRWSSPAVDDDTLDVICIFIGILDRSGTAADRRQVPGGVPCATGRHRCPQHARLGTSSFVSDDPALRRSRLLQSAEDRGFPLAAGPLGPPLRPERAQK